jgi:predicted RNA-binding protein
MKLTKRPKNHYAARELYSDTPRPRCRDTKKVRYKRRQEAESAIAFEQMHRGVYHALRPYWCKHCGDWHMTSQVEEDNAA